MPFASQAQRRWMFAAADRGEIPVSMPHEWAHHTPNMKSLPDHVGDKKKSKEKKGFSHMNTISALGKQAADNFMMEKLAADTQITPKLVEHLASLIKMSPSAFVKAAYDDPADYTIFLKLASGAIKPQQLTKGAAAGKLTLQWIKQRLAAAAQGATGATKPGGKAFGAQLPPVPKVQGGMLGTSNATTGVGRALEKTPLGKSQAGRIGTGVGAAGLGTAGVASLTGSSSAPTGSQTQSAIQSGVDGAMQAPNVAQNGPAPNPSQQGAGGSSAGRNAAMIGGGVAGGLGLGAMLRRRKRKEVQAMDVEFVKNVMRTALEKKAAALMRKEAADTLISYLDSVAALMETEKTAAVRRVQSEIAAGGSLAGAIKRAYPHLTGEQRGILACKMVEKAAKYKKGQSSDTGSGGRFRMQQSSSTTCKPGEAGKMMAKMSADREKQARELLARIARNKGMLGIAGGVGAGAAGAGMAGRAMSGGSKPAGGSGQPKTPIGQVGGALKPKV